jgi:hypothetical protein
MRPLGPNVRRLCFVIAGSSVYPGKLLGNTLNPWLRFSAERQVTTLRHQSCLADVQVERRSRSRMCTRTTGLSDYNASGMSPSIQSFVTKGETHECQLSGNGRPRSRRLGTAA